MDKSDMSDDLVHMSHSEFIIPQGSLIVQGNTGSILC